ncbi:MAG: ECF-type sigma factor [Planctomycetota bacterium]
MSDDADPELLASVHARLRALADRQMARERANHTLQATALVNEAWMSLRDEVTAARDNPAGFYLAAAESMRRILIDHARRRNAQKRGGDLGRLSLDLVEVASDANLGQVCAIDEAIDGLAAVSERAAKVVRLRFFAGLDEAEAARVLETSPRTVRREWAFARAWLYQKLAGDGGE